MKKIRLFAMLLGLVLIPALNIFAQLPGAAGSSKGIILQEDFDGITGLPVGWTDYTEDGWDMILVQNDAVMFFKQSTGVKLMILSTPLLDLTNASMLTFDFESVGVASTLKVGLMTDPLNPSTFQQLTTFQADTGWNSYQVPLGTVSGSYCLSFNWVGGFFKSSNLDNVLVVDDAAQNNVPSSVSALTLTAAPLGAPGGTVAWINPSLEADGDPLTDLDSLVVKLNNSYYTTLFNPPVGQPQSLDVTIDPPGFYTATVIPYNTAGEGVSTTTDPVWLGLDIPGEPLNVTLTQVGNLATISWSPPAVGAHGAYYNGEVTEYMITRADLVHDYVPGTDTSIVWDVTDPGTFNFMVTPFNTSGEGTSGTSNTGIFLTGNYLLWEDFWVSVPAYLWSIQGENDFNWWKYNSNEAGGEAPEVMFQSTTPGTVGQFRLASSPLNTTGNTALTLEFRQFHSWASGQYSFKVETSSDGGSTWHEAWAITVAEGIEAEKVTIVINNSDVGSANFQFAFTYDGFETNVNYFNLDEVRLFPTAGTDLASNAVLLPEVITPGEGIAPRAVIQSLSAEPASYVAKFMISNLSGTQIYSDSVTGTIPSGLIDTLSFANWVAVEGEFSAKTSLTCTLDNNASNDTAYYQGAAYYTYPRTMVVLEDATGTWCTYCPGAAMGIADLLENGYAIAPVAYHGGDTYETPESRGRINYYGITGYPTTVFDGVIAYIGGSHSQSLYSDYVPLVEQRLAKPSPVEITLDAMQIEGNTFTARVYLSSLSPIRNSHVVMFAVLTESNIPESWQDMTELDDVERKMFGDSTGFPVNLSDRAETVDLQFTVSDTWPVSNLDLVVFVQDIATREIFNGNRGFTVGIRENAGGVLAVYPNPAREQFRIPGVNNATVEMFDIAGIRVLRATQVTGTTAIGVASFAPGLYTLKITENGKTSISKIAVTH